MIRSTAHSLLLLVVIASLCRVCKITDLAFPCSQGTVAMKDILPKFILTNYILVQSRSFITFISVIKSSPYFAQSTTVILPSSVHHFEIIWRMWNKLLSDIWDLCEFWGAIFYCISPRVLSGLRMWNDVRSDENSNVCIDLSVNHQTSNTAIQTLKTRYFLTYELKNALIGLCRYGSFPLKITLIFIK